jgi:hypothetical protein
MQSTSNRQLNYGPYDHNYGAVVDVVGICSHKPRTIRRVYNRDLNAIRDFAAGKITLLQLKEAFDALPRD